MTKEHAIVRILVLLAISGIVLRTAGAEWEVDVPRPGVLVLRNDTGAWGGFSMGVSHINHPKYQARKVFNLGALPAGALEAAKAARLRFYFSIQDYSWAGGGAGNGLNESFEVVVNGTVLTFQTNDPRFPSKARRTDPLQADWVDIDLPLDLIQGRQLTVVIRKQPGTDDDYIYPGIDNSVTNTTSSVSFDGGNSWETDRLNTIDAAGEYMMRLVLASKDLRGEMTWTMGKAPRDPHGFAAFFEQQDSAIFIEPDPEAFDPFQRLSATVRHRGPAPEIAWIDERNRPIPAETTATRGQVTVDLMPGRRTLRRLQISQSDDTPPERLSISFGLPTIASLPQVDLRPNMSPPRGTRRDETASCTLSEDRALLTNGGLRAVFQLQPVFELSSLHAAEIDRNVLARPERTELFRIKLGNTVYGCRDARVAGISPTRRGFGADLVLEEAGVTCRVRAEIDDDELTLGLTVMNTGTDPVRFHTAFPHLAGLELSEDPAQDAYLFPWGGGVIAQVPAILRTAYGENTCWWQMVDMFSPERGGGLYVRIDDSDGLYKCPSLRKGRHVAGQFCVDETGRGYLSPDMQWRNALEPVEGLSAAFDYLRRDRGPGESFRLPDAVIGTHSGDWRKAMEVYAAWAHRVWRHRPYPSKLTPCWHITAPGWGQNPLYKDGRYRTDYLTDRHDVAEMMSWWTWSDLGPWNTPMDRLKEELGEALYTRYSAYWVEEPATGTLMYPLNRGDYDGYMPQWGGLPALRAHIERIRKAGLVPMFYTDPILACATTKLGGTYGPEYGIMNPAWKDPYKCPKTPEGYVGSYGSYNMCLDTEWYSQWVANTMARVCRETGIDGVRLDEYGHRGYVCTSHKHEHLFAEPGHNAWLQALARNVRQVHAAMDGVRTGLLLTTEFPGHDYMAASLEGAIVYDVRRIKAIRPTPVNLFRFYFPECKVFEINRPSRPEAHDWMLWNTVGAFSSFYPPNVHVMLEENNDVFTSRDHEPLVPTLVKRVYANRFRGGGKTIITIHNATGHTVDAPVLAVTPNPDFRLIDLLGGQSLKLKEIGDERALSMRLEPDQTRVIARLPKHLSIQTGRIQSAPDPDEATIAIVDHDGKNLATLQPGAALPELSADTRPALIKCLRNGLLLDAIPWP